MKFVSLIAILAVFVALSTAKVLILDDSNFDANIGKGKPALVEFFAPWCGHCKKLAPEYEIVGNAFKNKPVIIASVDCDSHKDLCSRFEVSGYPTLKWFSGSGDSEAFNGGREAPAIISWINTKTGLKVAVPGKAASNVVTLTNSNFDKLVKESNKDVLVKFYAPWCGHCKKLEPDYEKLATVFVNEDSVSIARVDCDEHGDVCKEYGVSGYPTLKYFPKGGAEPVEFNQERSLDALVEYVNEHAGTHRLSSGRLNEKAGVLEEFTDLVKRVANESPSELIEEAKKLADTIGSKSAQYYHRVFEKLASNAEFAKTELARLTRMLEGGSLQEKKADEFSERANILRTFVN